MTPTQRRRMVYACALAACNIPKGKKVQCGGECAMCIGSELGAWQVLWWVELAERVVGEEDAMYLVGANAAEAQCLLLEGWEPSK